MSYLAILLGAPIMVKWVCPGKETSRFFIYCKVGNNLPENQEKVPHPTLPGWKLEACAGIVGIPVSV